jgi:hypothetical protein
VPALGELVEVDEMRIGLLRPAPWRGIEFVGKDPDGNGDGDTFHVEISKFPLILPIEPGAGKRGIRQPCDRDVIENVVAGETL